MSSVDDLERRATPEEKGLTRRDHPESAGRRKLITFTRHDGIDWAAMESLIDKAQDFPTLNSYRDQLSVLQRYNELRGGAVRVKNAIARYIDKIDERRWEIKQRLITRGGSVHKATLPDLGLKKRDSQILDQKHSIPKDRRERYFDECDRNFREATEAGLLRLVVVEKPPAPRPPEGKYRVMIADPPWRYLHTPERINPPEAHYPTMSNEEICALGDKVRTAAAKDCTLFLWVPPCKLPEGLEVLAAWGFAYITNFVWHKGGRDIGPYCNLVHELVLIGKRGSGTPTTSDKKLIQSIDSVQSVPKTGRHSEKPLIFHEIVEKLWPGQPYLELFARNPNPKRKRWTYWGNEVDSN